MSKQLDSFELEEMVDGSSFSAVLEALGDIAAEKAEHLRSNWQDSSGGKLYEKIAGRLFDAAHSIGQIE